MHTYIHNTVRDLNNAMNMGIDVSARDGVARDNVAARAHSTQRQTRHDTL